MIEERYANILLHHLTLNPEYNPIVPLLPNTYQFELVLQKYNLLGMYLKIKGLWRKIKLKSSL